MTARLRCDVIDFACRPPIQWNYRCILHKKNKVRFLYGRHSYIVDEIKRYQNMLVFSPWRNSLYWVRDASLWRRHDHTQTHDRPSQRPLPDTQHSQEWGIHAPGGIQTYNPINRAGADPRLRPRDHWNWLKYSNKYLQNYILQHSSAILFAC